MSFGSYPAPESVISTRNTYYARLHSLEKLGVPTFTSAGNSADDRSRVNIDTYPAKLARVGLPISVVGEADLSGKLMSHSQRGWALSYAVGIPSVGVAALDRNGRRVYEKYGTSFSMPSRPR